MTSLRGLYGKSGRGKNDGNFKSVILSLYFSHRTGISANLGAVLLSSVDYVIDFKIPPEGCLTHSVWSSGQRIIVTDKIITS
jgi:hypothetical protein